MTRRTASFLLFAVTTLLITAACSDNDRLTGSGSLVETNFNLNDFSSVVAESGYAVEIRQDSTYAVSVTTDDNLTEFLDVYRSGSTLNLKLKPTTDADFTVLHADVQMPHISSLVFSSGASCQILEGFSSTGPLSVVLAAGASVEGAISSGDVSCVLSAGSRMLLHGSGGNGSLVCSAGSLLDLRSYYLSNVSISADGGSTVYVHCSGVLDVSASGGSRIFYTGNPTLGSISVTGGSTVQRLP